MSEHFEQQPCVVNPVSAERWMRLADSGTPPEIHRIFQTRDAYVSFLQRRPQTPARQQEQMRADIAFINELADERQLADPSRLRRIGYVVTHLFHR